MYERRANGAGSSQASADARGEPRRSQPSSGSEVRGAEQDADRTHGSPRRRRDSGRPRTRHARSRTTPGVLVGERERRLYLLAPEEIDYIESRGNYVEFHAEGVVYISRDSIKRLTQALADSGYIRIQRTLLLNIQSIVYAQRVGHGTYEFTLSSGDRLRSGAKYRQEILRILPLTRARRLDGT
jgi:DNA-binding LytR/AlgR family response regulator